MFKKKISGKIIKAIFVFISIALIVVWNPRSVFNGMGNIFFTVTYPVQNFFSSSADRISFLGETISSIGKLKNENEKLLYENISLKADNAKLKDISKENDILRNEIALLPRKKFDLIAAHIIGRDFYENNDWLLINKGERDGLKKGMPVIIGEGVLVGRISQVFPYSAKIVTITNPESNINATTVETGAMGIVKSNYGLGIILDMVLQTDYLKVGDDLITSEISQNIPRGLLIGKIEKVYPSEDKLFQAAILSVPIDFSKLRFVFVIKK